MNAKTTQSKTTETTKATETKPTGVVLQDVTTTAAPIVGNTALKVDEKATVTYDSAKLTACKNTSAKIRYLHGCGLSNGQIAKVLSAALGRQVRYQHVRNVIITPVKNV